MELRINRVRIKRSRPVSNLFYNLGNMKLPTLPTSCITGKLDCQEISLCLHAPCTHFERGFPFLVGNNNLWISFEKVMSLNVKAMPWIKNTQHTDGLQINPKERSTFIHSYNLSDWKQYRNYESSNVIENNFLKFLSNAL